MSTIKDRKGKDLIEAEEIKKRWQEYTEELYKKDLNDLDNHDGVVAHPEPDILEYEVKWSAGSMTTNKASCGDGIPAELFKILKDDDIKMLHSIGVFSCSVLSDSLQPHGLHHVRPPCPSPSPRACSNSCPSSR